MMQQKIKLASNSGLTHVDVEFDPEYHAVWAKLRYPDRPCISNGLINDLQQVQSLVSSLAKKGHKSDDPERLRYQILCSSQPGVFCLGGDLDLFIKLIRQGDRTKLADYAKDCIDILYASITGYNLPFTTIALVQGETLGGGFEAALAANVLIAERSSKFGFPETVFGMFPGMGAFSFLARKIAPAMAKRIISSGKVYTADELYQLGVVDQVVDDGKGVAAVREFIRHQQVRSAGFEGLEKVMEQFNPLSYKELMDVVNIWVDTAMKLSGKNLRLMEYLVNAQNKRWSASKESTTVLQQVSSA
ncbi:MAG: crotonase/enoyl-CoA hydratase family protein [Sedimenticola sp.]|uniref:Enoyl-CoA hydratase n=1 Tax=Sedimenticola thiotaurini TaxID=1543721 RepID=A0A558CTJ4_9GAMM|nr:crotonase/enoyl-CoA hydratase family protein [Sedimenticola sp.]MCW8921109.1 crotonase/enoyl-CoA hydratase family protein [Sedimenticola sp.]TVT52012.1 MAG: enoyl-CoA hydratase [Sedimenticola thiotaurini]